MKKQKEKREKEVEKKQKKVKAVKETPKRAKKSAGEKTSKNKKGQLLTIRNKIFVCFLVPTIFIIVVGFTAYNMASGGMTEKFQESTIQTLNMAVEYIELGNALIESKSLEYAYDKELNQYASGLYKDDLIGAGALTTAIREDMGSAKNSNPFIADIYIVTKKDITMATTKKSTVSEGIFDEYMAVTPMDGKLPQKWIDSHELLDTHLEATAKEYIMAYQQMSQNKTFCVVFDIKTDTIREQLESLDLGAGSIVGLVTENGFEVIAENVEETAKSIVPAEGQMFYGQDFYQDAVASDAESGAWEVKYNGDKYLFIYSKSDRNLSTIGALVPMKTVIGQAEYIKTITVGLVLLAGIISSFIGIFIASGIQKNMKNISKCLGKVAQGDLTLSVQAKGNDEFRGLSEATTNMIRNNKKLVQKVNHATEALEESARNVNTASGVIHDYSGKISGVVMDISESMMQQSQYAQECVQRTDSLSDEIQEIGRIMTDVEELVGKTEQMIATGMNTVQMLGERAVATTTITTEVGESIASLQKESQIINEFVGMINDISEQTNLLSLNASIEAARAGQAGRGFAVVAEEIRKLADDSTTAANEIKKNVENITQQTQKSVESAVEAQKMVGEQKEAVDNTVEILSEMNQQMTELILKLREIMMRTEQADTERGETLEAVKRISAIIDNTAESAEEVSEVIEQLADSVRTLGDVSGILEDNMDDLKTEIAVFKTE